MVKYNKTLMGGGGIEKGCLSFYSSRKPPEPLFLHSLRMGWRNIQIALIFFARIISFMLFTVLLLLINFISENFIFTINADS